MKITKLIEGDVSNLGSAREARRFGVMTWDEANGFSILEERLGRYSKRHQTVESAVGYIKAYHDAYYANTQINEVPHQDHIYTEIEDDIDDPGDVAPVNGMVYGFYDPREKERAGVDAWLADVQAWVVDLSQVNEEEF